MNGHRFNIHPSCSVGYGSVILYWYNLGCLLNGYKRRDLHSICIRVFVIHWCVTPLWAAFPLKMYYCQYKCIYYYMYDEIQRIPANRFSHVLKFGIQSKNSMLIDFNWEPMMNAFFYCSRVFCLPPGTDWLPHTSHLPMLAAAVLVKYSGEGCKKWNENKINKNNTHIPQIKISIVLGKRDIFLNVTERWVIIGEYVLASLTQQTLC